MSNARTLERWTIFALGAAVGTIACWCTVCGKWGWLWENLP